MTLASVDLTAIRAALASGAEAVDASGRFPVESLRVLRSSGLFGLLVPREYGGLGGTYRDLVDVAYTLAGGCLNTAFIWSMHCQQVVVLANYAPEPLKAHVLPRIASGDLYIASVTTGLVTGGSVLSSEHALRVDGSLITIDRPAPIVTGAAHADCFLLTMRAGEGSPETAVRFVYADRSQVEVEIQGDWAGLGMRGSASVPCTVRGTVPPEQVVTDATSTRSAILQHFVPAGHLGWSACWLGAARQALHDVVKHHGRVSTRTVSDLRLAELARARLELELAAGYLHHVADHVVTAHEAGRDLGAPASQIELNAVKVASSELCYSAVDRLIAFVGLDGGYQTTGAARLERHFRDLRSASLNYGNDRLISSIAALTLLDRRVSLPFDPEAGTSA